jgi:UDP-N-acetylmuramyl pentapeptide phosphotransferase/UDP-N-acetylglucosamine-1-phosphate transferase
MTAPPDPIGMVALAAALAFAAGLAATRLLVALGGRGVALDVPNARSLHGRPVPRSGGVAVLAGVAAGWSLLPMASLAAVGVIGLALAGISLLDDLRGVPVLWRLAAHLAAAAGLVGWLGMADPVLALAGVLGVAWAVNLYNFMDGADGLAGGMALFGFACYALAAALAGDLALAAGSAAIAAAAAGFLVFNFPPARIFLGDVGAIPLGFLAAALGLVGWMDGHWGGWFPLLVFAPFWVDASVTLAVRWRRGARLWQAHRDHAYQRLVRLGLGHRGVAWLAYALMLASGALGLLAWHVPAWGAWIAVGWSACLALGVLAVGRAWAARGVGE